VKMGNKLCSNNLRMGGLFYTVSTLIILLVALKSLFTQFDYSTNCFVNDNLYHGWAIKNAHMGGTK